MRQPAFLVIDLFCGAGGTTTGFEMTAGIAKVVACVNHDPKAIESHWANHPDVLHFEEDIRTLSLTPLIDCVEHWKEVYPDTKLILWASLECTNFSKAKGGMPRDADSRTLANDLLRYIEYLRPDLVLIENVEEFMSWGPLNENGKPLSRQNGIDYLRWVGTVCSYSYTYDYRILNAADFGAYTSRKRYFGAFAMHGVQIVFPQPTHAKNPKPGGMFETLQSWKPVREVLDLEDHGTSIFDRKKPLSEKTLSRIYAGLLKYVAGGEESMLIKWRSHKGNNFSGSVSDVNDPCPTVTTMNHLGVAKCFILKYNSTNGKTGKHVPPSIDNPSPALTCQQRLGLCFISKYYSGNPQWKNIPVDGPAGTITTIDSQSLVNVCFLQSYYGNGQPHDIQNPCPTVPTKDRFGLVYAQWLDRQYSSGQKCQSIDTPAGTLLTVPKFNLCSVCWPGSLTFNRKYHYLVNPQYSNTGSSVEKPCFTLIARMDKKPPYIVTTQCGEPMIQVFEEDTGIMVKIKEFMAVHGIVDIKMRMLKVPELLRIQGFSDGYKLSGNQRDQKKFIGNSVVPHVVKAWAESLADALKK